MPGYVKESLCKLQHHPPVLQQHSPHQWNLPNYGSTEPQMAHQEPELPKLAPPESNTVQQVVGCFLYYARAVDPTMLVSLNIITSEQANKTEATTKSVAQLRNYAATQYEAITRYHASGIILHIHSDISFLSDI